MGLAFSQIDDAVLLTQNHFIKRGTFVNMQTDLTRHVACREIWKGKRKKFDGGAEWDFSIQMDHNHSARVVGMYEQDGSSQHDTMVRGAVPPRHVNAHYIYDQREPAFQRGGTAIVDLIKTRMVGMHISFYELLEVILWGKPVDSTDLKTPYGIAYWITRSLTEGFNGKNPDGFAAGRAGINSDTYPRWANWTAGYKTVSKQDLIRKMRRATRQIDFRSPVSNAEPKLGGMGNGIYVNDNVIGLIEEQLELQNMNLGNDIASKDGRAVFKGTPLVYAPKLDGDEADPIYMIDWEWLTCGVMPGWENRLTAPYMVPGKHLVRRVDMDVTLQLVGTDLRRQAVFTKE